VQRLLELLQQAMELGASDLHLTVGQAPAYRLDGELRLMNLPRLLPADTREMLDEVTTPVQREALRQQGDLDFALSLPGVGRFRVNVYQQRGSIAMACRLIPFQIPSIAQLGLPPVVEELTGRHQGLILVTGPTGSGKSSTLAAMIDLINRRRAGHIMTLEDPIEFLHSHKLSIVNQREIGVDTPSYAAGVRSALHEDPDVLLVGEMRDLETTAAALSAAETGMLVMATLHTQGAAQTVNRILDIFPPHQQQQVRTQLALTLQAVISQQLVRRAQGPGRVLAAEVLIMTPAIRHLIREGKVQQIPSQLQTGSEVGMQTMEKALQDLYQRGLITQEQMNFYLPELGLINTLLGRA
jgi:twitching motility protein PilT